MRKLQLCEVVFLSEDGMWENEIVEIPADITEKESQDAFIEWVYSEDGEDFRGNWQRNVVAVYVWSWPRLKRFPKWATNEKE